MLLSIRCVSRKRLYDKYEHTFSSSKKKESEHNMKTITIKELAYLLKQAKKKGEPQPIFFLGAGASKSGNIPLAQEIVNDILKVHADSPFIKKLQESERTYAKLMECLQPFERSELLKGYIDNAKINVTHIYLAQLLNVGFVDYVLSVNFDNLMLRALSLYNEFPATYDMAILKDLTTTTFRERSVVYLHGQYHGLWLLNTADEMGKVNSTLPRIFDSIKNKRPWILIGYSGSDPVFEHIKKLGRFDNGLYWVGYKENEPSANVKEFLDSVNINAHFIKGYDSDAFMLKLNESLGLGQPQILDKPFSCLKDMINNINDINEEEHFKGVKERLEIAKKDVENSITQFEMKEPIQIEQNEFDVDKLKKDIINLLISEDYNLVQIERIEEKAFELKDDGVNSLLSGLYSDWGTDLGELAQTKEGKDAEDLYHQAFEKFQKAVEIKPDKHEALYNWGIDLGNLAQTKEGKDAEDLYHQAFEKFQKAVEIKPDKHEAFNNWGNFLGKLAQTKEGKDAEDLYHQAFEKFQKAVEIKPDFHDAFNNWGTDLGNLAQTKEGKDAEDLYHQAFEKFQKAVEIKPDEHDALYNWGTYLGELAQTKEGKDAEDLYHQAFEKFQKAVEIKPDEHDALYNWGNFLGELAQTKEGKDAEDLYHQAFEKYQKAVEIKPDEHDALYNWGTYLGELAQTKEGKDAEDLYHQAFEKFQKAVEIKPDKHEAFNNWGTSLGELAQTKEGKDAEDLYHQAFEKFQKAVEIKPDKHEAFNNWGTYLGNLAQTKEEKDAEDLYHQAFEKFQKAVILGGGSYNLSCMYALKQDKENALKYLDRSLTNNEIEVEFILNDEDWKLYLNDPDFILLIDKYLNKRTKTQHGI